MFSSGRSHGFPNNNQMMHGEHSGSKSDNYMGIINNMNKSPRSMHYEDEIPQNKKSIKAYKKLS